MKYLFFILFISCSKNIDKPQVINCQSVINLIDRYDNKWNYLRTDTAIVWCNVCGEELERFKSLVGRKELLCEGQYDSIYWKIDPYVKCKNN